MTTLLRQSVLALALVGLALLADACFDSLLPLVLDNLYALEIRAVKPTTAAEVAASRAAQTVDDQRRAQELLAQAIRENNPTKIEEVERLRPLNFAVPLRRSAMLYGLGQSAAALEAETTAFTNYTATRDGSARAYRNEVLYTYASQMDLDRAAGRPSSYDRVRTEFCNMLRLGEPPLLPLGGDREVAAAGASCATR